MLLDRWRRQRVLVRANVVRALWIAVFALEVANDVEGLPYTRPTPEALTAFIDTLRRSGLSVKVRKRKGSEIDAACGQLRRKVEQEVASAV